MVRMFARRGKGRKIGLCALIRGGDETARYSRDLAVFFFLLCSQT